MILTLTCYLLQTCTTCFYAFRSRDFYLLLMLALKAIPRLCRSNVRSFGLISTDNPVISGMISSLHCVHELAGPTWWVPVVACTFAMKSVLVFPLAVHTQKLLDRRQKFLKELKLHLEHLKWKTAMAHKQHNWSNKTSNNVFNFNKQEIRRSLVLKYNCHFAKIPIGTLFSACLWLHMSFSLRHLTGRVPFMNTFSPAFESSLGDGGLLWFQNLLVPDPYFVLPVVMLLANFTNIHLSSKPIGSAVAQPKITKYLMMASRIGTVVMFGVACQTPSLITLYWATSAIFGLLQNLLFRSQMFCSLVGVPFGSSALPKKSLEVPKTTEMKETSLPKP